MSERVLLRGGHVISCDPAIGDLDGGDVLVEGGEIADVGVGLPDHGCEVIDTSGGIVLPGLVDAHSHLWEQALRNVGVDWSLAEYHRVIRGIFGGLYRPEDIYAGNLLGAVEAINSGVTTVLDCSHNMNSPEHADAAVEGLRDSGLRSILAYGSANDHWTPEGADEPLPEDARRVRAEHFPGDDGLVTMALCPRASAPPHILAGDLRMARELDVPVSLTGGTESPTLGGAVHKGADVAGSRILALHREGLTGPHVQFYHCTMPHPDELDVIVEDGCKAAITPENELRAAYGIASVVRLRERGVHPGLGVDTPAIASDYFTAMRATLAAEGARQHLEAMDQGHEVDMVRLTVRDVLELATVRGAEACWLGDRTGSLTPGKEADVIEIDKAALSLTPVYHPRGAVVYNGSPASVRTVLVAGRPMKVDGQVVGVDVKRSVRLADESRRYLFETAGLDPYTTTFP